MLQLLVALLLLVLPAAAQESVPCRSCESRGAIDCSKHGKLLPKEQVSRFCSVVAECKSCGGALAVDCRSCRNTKAETELDRRKAMSAELLAARRKAIDEVTRNVPLMHLACEHLDLCFSIKPHVIGKEKFDTHALMHLYGERIEGLRADFVKLLELKPEELTGRLEVYMFRDQQDQSVIGPKVTGIGTSGSTGVKLMGVECVYSMWQDPRSMTDDEALHRNLVHNLTHLLLSNMTPSQWIGNRKHGWVDEGLAHWFEDRVTGRCTNFCFEEVLVAPGTGYKNGKWRPAVRQLVDAGKVRSFAELSTLNTDQLELPDHALVFAWVDYFLARGGGAKFAAVVRMLKEGATTQDALRKVMGVNMLVVDTEFAEWVKANYSLLDR